jgi:hypothetical protein
MCGGSDALADEDVGGAGEQSGAACGVHDPYMSSGSRTESMTWTTPFEASTSVLITLALALTVVTGHHPRQLRRPTAPS